MAGIGDYEKGKPFTLKSGNKPTFKTMGSDSPLDAGLKHFTTNERPRTNSPNNLKDFGVGEGTSPYKQSVKSHAGDPWSYRKNAKGQWETRKGDGDWIIAKKGGSAEADIEKKYGSQITDTKTENNTKTNGTKTDGTNTNGNGNSNAEEAPVEEKKKGAGLGGILLGALTGGLDAVYGTGKILPPSSARLIKKKVETDTKEPGDNIADNIINPASTSNIKKTKSMEF